MGAALPIRGDVPGEELRRLARLEANGRVACRLIALANALDGMSRDRAAKQAGMDRQTLRDWVIRFNAETHAERYVPLAQAAGIDTEGTPALEVAHALAARIKELADMVGVPKNLRALGVTETDVQLLARNTLQDACLTTNPREAGAAEIEWLFRAAL